MSVARDLPREPFDLLFQLRVTLRKRTPAGQPFARGQTGEPAFVDALAGGQFSERAEVIHIHLIGCGEIRQVEPLEEGLVIRACYTSGAVRGDYDAVCHGVGTQRESDRLARDEFPRLRRSGAEGRVPAANQPPAAVGGEGDRADFKAVRPGEQTRRPLCQSQRDRVASELVEAQVVTSPSRIHRVLVSMCLTTSENVIGYFSVAGQPQFRR